MKRHNKIADLPPKEVLDRSSLAGPFGFNLKRIVREQPWLTNEQLSEALRPFCGQNKDPPSRVFFGKKRYNSCRAVKKTIN